MHTSEESDYKLVKKCMAGKRRQAGQESALAGTLTVTELADYLKISRSMIYRLLKRGELPGSKIGSDWRFYVEEIDRWRADREISSRQL
jgi:excisionase family DNA binding protein